MKPERPPVSRCPLVGKCIYPSKVAAQTAANGYHRRHGRSGDKKVRPYPCWYCGCWHIGHIAPREDVLEK